jgi:hypothetical protein
MIIEIFLVMQVIVIALFFISFFVRNEMLWALTILFAIILALNCLDIQYNHYVYNTTTTGYDWAVTTYTYPFLMWANIVLVAFSLLFLIYDIWENYLLKVGKINDEGTQDDKLSNNKNMR